MSRQPRPDLAGITQHVVERGKDRHPRFFTPQDHGCYLADLTMAARRYGVPMHTYALMTNHGHLLVSSAGAGARGQGRRSALALPAIGCGSAGRGRSRSDPRLPPAGTGTWAGQVPARHRSAAGTVRDGSDCASPENGKGTLTTFRRRFAEAWHQARNSLVRQGRLRIRMWPMPMKSWSQSCMMGMGWVSEADSPQPEECVCCFDGRGG